MLFADALSKKQFDENNVEAGRKYVKAYISFMHHVEDLYEESHKGEETGRRDKGLE